jgi:hypothetical protein
VYRSGTSDLLGLRLVDTGSGYNAQNAKPVHIGLTGWDRVDVHVTTMSSEGRRTTRFNDIDPRALGGKPFVARVSNRK